MMRIKRIILVLLSMVMILSVMVFPTFANETIDPYHL